MGALRLLIISFILMRNSTMLFSASAAPKAELWHRWQAADPWGTTRVDHGPWQAFLKNYLVTDDPSGVNKIRYSYVTPQDKTLLEHYLKELQAVRVSELKREEQKPYWINLYNALIVKVVLDHYPVESIQDINISPGLLSRGPWGAKLLKIQGEGVSLNDIEHRILRPIWKDNRVHYALNCASLSCPNLQPEAYTAENMEELLERGVRDYVNHPRGVRFEKAGLVLSSIYDWYGVDFGGRTGIIQHLLRYVGGALAKELAGFQGKIRYEYDWRLNDWP
ncbi:MAG: DUF547 domain-containing protein [bacterium]